MSRLAGRTAFITGAGGGIGSATCRRFLDAGARVAAVDVDPAAAQPAVGQAPEDGRALVAECDVGDANSVQAAIGRTASQFGSLDILVNIAGGSTDADGPVIEAPEDKFWPVMRLDLFGTFRVCKYGIPHFIAAGGGSVVNLTSVLALMAMPRRDCYTGAKGGVASMTRSMAAWSALFLASEESARLTGQILKVHSGVTIH